ncbi:MAG: glycosyltransferase family 1 protein [Lysobacterales bacterium]|jgi:glycosyltransferase involved in cell wall biosynthesis
MKIAIVTDAWAPQVSGVVTTMANTARSLTRLGHDVTMVTPEGFRTMPCPGYAEIRLSIKPKGRVFRMLDALQPDAIHIATEGPLGHAARRWCLRNGMPFATSYHTQFPEYIRLRAPVPLRASYAYLRRFHRPAHTTLVRTATQKRLLKERGFEHLAVWPGAVDTSLFRPRGKSALCLPRPIAMYMGRVAVEKGLDGFLDLELPGSKVVMGGGPDLEKLRDAYPGAHFLGAKFGEELARLLSAADVFVFPSRTDTLGLVMLEAMACGVPVAAFPVPGPADVVREGSTGALDDDLAAAVFRALSLDGEACIEFAEHHSWARSTRRFLRFQQARVDTGAAGAEISAMQAPAPCRPDRASNDASQLSAG